MKEYLKNNKGFTVKELAFTIVAIILAFIIGFALSYIFTNNSKQYIDRIAELENEIQELEDGEYIEEDEEDELGDDEVYEPSSEDILYASYSNAIYITSDFEYEELKDNEQTEILNYKEAMQEVFTENGQKIFEEENKSYIEIKNGKAYISKNMDDTGEYLIDINFEDIKEDDDNTITATVVRKMSKEPIDTFNEGELKDSDMYTLKDEIVLKKVNNYWLVDKYSWVVSKS